MRKKSVVLDEDSDAVVVWGSTTVQFNASGIDVCSNIPVAVTVHPAENDGTKPAPANDAAEKAPQKSDWLPLCWQR